MPLRGLQRKLLGRLQLRLLIVALYPVLIETLARARARFDLTASSRRDELERLSQFLARAVRDQEPLQATVICTHNSRRSHLGQFWLAAMGHHFGVPMAAFSGGTEVTACHPNTIAALEQAGARIDTLTQGPNPRYRISYGPDHAIDAWSKHFADGANPAHGFAALLVCTEADGACPLVPGASGRFLLPYRDPKHADGTPEQADAYEATCLEIAAELAWVIEQLSPQTRI